MQKWPKLPHPTQRNYSLNYVQSPKRHKAIFPQQVFFLRKVLTKQTRGRSSQSTLFYYFMFLRVPDSQQGDKGSDSTTEEQPQGIEMEGKSPRKDKKEKKEKKKEGKTPRSARGEKKDGAKTPRRKEEGSAILDMPNIEVSGPTNKVSVQLKDCPVQSVTVYNDRAEVTRTLVASIKAGTFNTGLFFFWRPPYRSRLFACIK